MRKYWWEFNLVYEIYQWVEDQFKIVKYKFYTLSLE